jgi:hypothetical protein
MAKVVVMKQDKQHLAMLMTKRLAEQALARGPQCAAWRHTDGGLSVKQDRRHV